LEKRFDLAAVEALRLTDVINFPNPFSDATTVSFRVLKEADVVVRVYTVGGRPVRTLRSSGVSGWGHVEWDGKDEEGDEVSNGVYIYKVTAATTDGGSERADAVGKTAKIR
jgi:flagellar hook assembly protein FlgD